MENSDDMKLAGALDALPTRLGHRWSLTSGPVQHCTRTDCHVLIERDSDTGSKLYKINRYSQEWVASRPDCTGKK